ncbi:MAG: hypothetical protein LBM38_01500, partial [Clostridiales bacterium]|nr:hypothetical protein [Clostridiales bacterium]
MMISKISFNSSGNKIPQNSSIASANVTSAPISDVKIPFVKTNNLTPPNPNFVQVRKVNNYIQRMNTQ